jgi:hypothetical protein
MRTFENPLRPKFAEQHFLDTSVNKLRGVVFAPADGRRHGAGGARHQEDPRPRRGPARADPDGRHVRGVALYLLGHNAFRLRDVGSVPRLVATVAALALIPVAVRPRPWSPSGPRRGSWRHSRPTRRRGTGRSGANCAARPEAIRFAAATRHARPVSHGAVGQDTGEHHPGFSVR